LSIFSRKTNLSWFSILVTEMQISAKLIEKLSSNKILLRLSVVLKKVKKVSIMYLR
jgi:hypothetical protein